MRTVRQAETSRLREQRMIVDLKMVFFIVAVRSWKSREFGIHYSENAEGVLLGFLKPYSPANPVSLGKLQSLQGPVPSSR